MPLAATEPSWRSSRSVVSTGLSGQGWSARWTGHVGPAVTRPSTPDGAGQAAKAPAAGPLPAGWAQGGAHGWLFGAADGQGGGQASGPGHGGGQDWLGGTGAAVVVPVEDPVPVEPLPDETEHGGGQAYAGVGWPGAAPAVDVFGGVVPGPPSGSVG